MSGLESTNHPPPSAHTHTSQAFPGLGIEKKDTDHLRVLQSLVSQLSILAASGFCSLNRACS
jgi:hypothetical protein